MIADLGSITVSPFSDLEQIRNCANTRVKSFQQFRRNAGATPMLRGSRNCNFLKNLHLSQRE